ncbi:AI-2E family transporter [Pistricoccus aurantiacus]|uniref:AI-2E family transporter n=1 Tax=Pistricoccus aurantiacus TaxID=1883414 RepID=UPI0036436D0B
MNEHDDLNEEERSIPFKLIFSLAALVIIVAGMKAGASLLVPVLLALFITVVCTSPVHLLQKLGIGGRLSILITLGLIILFFTLVGLLLVNSFSTFNQQLPQISERLNDLYLDLLIFIAGLGVAIEPDQLTQWWDPSRGAELFQDVLSGVGTFIVQSMVVSFLAIFMLFETLNFRRTVWKALDDPAPSLRRFQEFSLTLRRYLAVKAAISLITGVLVWISCLLLGVGFPLVWATLAFALNFIPNIGSVLAAIPAVLFLLISPDGGFVEALILAGAYLLINVVLGNIVEPQLMGRALGLSTFVAFLSLVVWGWIFGVVGLLLSVLLTMTLKIALDSHPSTQWIARMLGPVEPAQEKNRRKTLMKKFYERMRLAEHWKRFYPGGRRPGDGPGR